MILRPTRVQRQILNRVVYCQRREPSSKGGKPPQNTKDKSLTTGKTATNSAASRGPLNPPKLNTRSPSRHELAIAVRPPLPSKKSSAAAPANRERQRVPLSMTGNLQSIPRWVDGKAPKVFVIDLDLPPERRWSEAVEWGASILRTSLSGGYDEYPKSLVFKNPIGAFFERRRNFTREQYQEIKAIAEHARIPFRRLLAFNHWLNVDFHCTSGTVKLKETGKLVHFRVLDPAISIPHLLIQAVFVRGGEVVARAIMHLGHVAITTGVRKGLSLSINTSNIGTNDRSIWLWAESPPWPVSLRHLLLKKEVPPLHEALRVMKRGIPNVVNGLMCDGRDTVANYGATDEDVDIDGILVQGNHFPWKSRTTINYAINASPNMEVRLDASKRRVDWAESYIAKCMRENQGEGLTLRQIQNIITSSPVKHAETTLACIMDPTEGTFLWVGAYQGR